MSGNDPAFSRKAQLKRLVEAAEPTFWGYLGCELVSLTESRVEIALEIRQHHLNLLGILHGGVHAALLDNAMGLVAMTAKPEQRLVTTNLNIHYLSPVGRENVTVTSEIVHMSGRMVTARGSVMSESGEVFAIGTGSFRVI